VRAKVEGVREEREGEIHPGRELVERGSTARVVIGDDILYD